MPVGMGVPTECHRLVQALKKIYGEPPSDLTVSYSSSDKLAASPQEYRCELLDRPGNS